LLATPIIKVADTCVTSHIACSMVVAICSTSTYLCKCRFEK
jgi:hypothetical protein